MMMHRDSEGVRVPASGAVHMATNQHTAPQETGTPQQKCNTDHGLQLPEEARHCPRIRAAAQILARLAIRVARRQAREAAARDGGER